MLLNFSVTNYRSFKEKTDFTMFPAKPNAENKNVNTMIPSDGKPLSLFRTTAIYGANASGKSNLLRAISAMDKIVRSQNLKNFIKPYLLSEETSKQPTEFVVSIIAEDDVVYEYGFSATAELIHKEWLYAYPKGRQKVFYERELVNSENKEYKYVNKLTGIKKAWEELTKENKLFLSTAVDYNNQQLLPVYNWFKKKLCAIGSHGVRSFHSAKYCFDGNSDEVLKFLKEADMNIANINVKEAEVPKEIKEFMKGVHGEDAIYDIFTSHETEEGEFVDFDLDEDESDGTKKMFALSYPILNTLKEGHILFIDELDNSLHPLLVKHIISLFNNKERNKNNAQLIFSTHDTIHFNNKDFQIDQLWMCDKDNKGASELYSLSDYKLRTDIKNLPARYLSGRYGGIPNLSAAD